MEDLLASKLQDIGIFILLTFLAVQAVRVAAAKLFGTSLGDWSIFVALLIGVAFALGWHISLAPEPPGTETSWVIFGRVITGVIIAGAASGVYSWASKLLPWLSDSGNTDKI